MGYLSHTSIKLRIKKIPTICRILKSVCSAQILNLKVMIQPFDYFTLPSMIYRPTKHAYEPALSARVRETK